MTAPTAERGVWWLAGLVGLCLVVGAAGGLATAGAVRDWYPTLARPSWTPPNAVFGPVWTTLYVLIGIAGWLVRPGAGARRAAAPGAPAGTGPAPRGNAPRRLAWRLWWVQLALNAVWSPLFFGAHRVGLAALDITLLWIAIGAFVFAAARVSRAAAWLFAPYWMWVTYAGALNVAIWLLNR